MENEAKGMYFACKTTHYHVLHTKVTHKKSVKTKCKNHEKTIYKPQKGGSRLGETLGFEKASFSRKKRKSAF